MKVYFVFDECRHQDHDGHFTEESAKEAVKNIRYTDKFGIVQTGAHWDLSQVKEATQNVSMPDGTTEWDKWVAYNAIYADLCRVLPDEQLLKVAYEFFFNDEDYVGNDSKIWRYVMAMAD